MSLTKFALNHAEKKQYPVPYQFTLFFFLEKGLFPIPNSLCFFSGKKRFNTVNKNLRYRYNSTVPVTFYVPWFWPQVSLSLRCLCCVPMRTTCTKTCAQRCLHVHVGSLGVGGYFTEQNHVAVVSTLAHSTEDGGVYTRI